MTLAESVMVLGLVGLGALGAASLSGNLTDGAKKSEGIVARSQFAASLGILLNSDIGCSKLKGLGGGSATFSATAAPISIDDWNYQGLTSIKGGYDVNGKPLTPTRHFEIEKLEAFFDQPIDATNDPAIRASKGSANDDLFKAVLKVKASLKVGNRVNDFFYNIPVLATSAGKIELCSDKKGIAETCAILRGVYNTTSGLCELDKSCQIKGTYSNLSCTGTIERNGGGIKPVQSPGDCQTLFGPAMVNQYTNVFSCPPDSVAELTHSTSWTYTKNAKKNSANIQNTHVWYNCMHCPAP